MADLQPFAKLDSLGFDANGNLLIDGTNITDLLREIAARVADVGDCVAVLSPDTAGRLRVYAESVATIANITTVATVSTVTNMAQVGGLAANQQIIAQTQLAEMALRQNIVIS